MDDWTTRELAIGALVLLGLLAGGQVLEALRAPALSRAAYVLACFFVGYVVSAALRDEDDGDDEDGAGR
jgi:hypothetical protein